MTIRQILFYLCIILYVKGIISIESSQIKSECRYISVGLQTQTMIRNQNSNTNLVMNDLYRRIGRNFAMSSSQIKQCLESKYKKSSKPR